MNQRAGFQIFDYKGNTCYGAAACSAKIVFALIHNTGEIMPAAALLKGAYGITDVALSVPCLIGKERARVVPYEN